MVRTSFRNRIQKIYLTIRDKLNNNQDAKILKAAIAAPYPLSILTTNNPGAQLASIPSKAVLPPPLIPYPTDTGSPIIG